MIRKSNKFDKEEVIGLMKMFKSESDIISLQKLDNEDLWSRMFDSMNAGAGIIFLEEGKGLIMGMVVPSIWCDKTFSLHELAWYVKPEYRDTSIGYRLFKAFINYGEQLKLAGRISSLVMGIMHNSPNINYGKYGFEKMEETWIKEL